MCEEDKPLYIYKREQFAWFPDEDIPEDDVPINMVLFAVLTDRETGEVKSIIAEGVRCVIAPVVGGVLKEKDAPKREITIPPFLVPGKSIEEAIKNFPEAKENHLKEGEKVLGKEMTKMKQRQNIIEGKSKGGIVIARRGIPKTMEPKNKGPRPKKH